MKKVLIAAIIILQLCESKAQSVSVNYTRHFKKIGDDFLRNNKLVPQVDQQFSLQYSQKLKKAPIVINASISGSRKPPPRPIRIDPPIIYDYRIRNNIEADSATFFNDKTTSVDFMTGIGYIIPHKPNSKVVFSANLDFGVSVNSKQGLNFYYNGSLTKKVEVQKLQFIINPSIKARYAFSKTVGIGFAVGYSNLGGINSTVGFIFNPFGGGKDCLHMRCCWSCDGPLPKKINNN